MAPHRKRKTMAQRDRDAKTLAGIGRRNTGAAQQYKGTDEDTQGTAPSRIEGKRAGYCTSAREMAARISQEIWRRQAACAIRKRSRCCGHGLGSLLYKWRTCRLEIAI